MREKIICSYKVNIYPVYIIRLEGGYIVRLIMRRYGIVLLVVLIKLGVNLGRYVLILLENYRVIVL